MSVTWNPRAEEMLAKLSGLDVTINHDSMALDKLKYDIELELDKEIKNRQANPASKGWSKVCQRRDIEVTVNGIVYDVQLGKDEDTGVYYVQRIQLG